MKRVQEHSFTQPRVSFASGYVPNTAEQSTEHRLDEEALSRMDDEGGSSSPAVDLPSAERTSPGSETNLIDCESELQWL
jgi:hypothetical protein